MKQKIIDTNWEKLIKDELDVNNACSNFTPLTTTISFIVVGRFTINFLFKSPRQIIWLFSSSACFNIKSKNCHDGTYVTFKCGFSNQKTYQRTIWDYKRGDYTLMKQKIIDTNWEKLINDELDETVDHDNIIYCCR
jgi:hypothetical protein